MGWLDDALDFGSNLLDFGGKIYGAVDQNRRRKENKKLYRTQIQTRVEDAKRAGIHPLFALGASTGVSPTLSTGGGMGDAISSIGKGIGSRGILRAQMAQAQASARRDEAEAALLNSQRKTVEQQLYSRGHDTVGVQGDPAARTYGYGVKALDGTHAVAFGEPEYVRPLVPVSKATGVTAGSPPLKTDFIDDDGTVVRVYSDAAQAEELRQVQLIIHEAKKRMAKNLSAGRRWMEREMHRMNLKFEVFKRRKKGGAK